MTMTTRYHVASEIMGYSGGRLHVTKAQTQPPVTERMSFYQENPGYLAIATIPSGPKDWSPYGLVPKGWVFIFKMPDMVITISASWQVRLEHWLDFQFTFPLYLNSNLYFVPKPKRAYWAREILDPEAEIHYWDRFPYAVGEGSDLWHSLCSLSRKLPLYYGPWPTDSGVRCKVCDAVFRRDLKLEIR